MSTLKNYSSYLADKLDGVKTSVLEKVILCIYIHELIISSNRLILNLMIGLTYTHHSRRSIKIENLPTTTCPDGQS